MIWRDILCRQPVTEIERRYTRIRRPSHVGRRGLLSARSGWSSGLNPIAAA